MCLPFIFNNVQICRSAHESFKCFEMTLDTVVLKNQGIMSKRVQVLCCSQISCIKFISSSAAEIATFFDGVIEPFQEQFEREFRVFSNRLT